MKTTAEVMAEIADELESGDETETEVDEGGEADDAEIEEPGSEEGDESEQESTDEDEGGEEADDSDEEGADEGRVRDPKTGKFTREKTPGQKVVEHDKARKAAQAAAGAASQQAALKPPADWKAEARAEWDKLPRKVQEESIRLHLETKKVLQESAQARQVAETFQRATAPYEHLFRASGRSAIDGVGYLLQTYNALHTAPMQQRAQIVGGLIRDFLGTDDNAINLLASALEGKGGAAPAGGGAQALTPAQVEQMVSQRLQQQQADSARQAELKVISDFEATNPEFLNDVTNEIKAIVAIEKQAGKPITGELLKSAYDKALRLNPTTAAILKQRDDAAAAKEREKKRLQGKAATSGLKNEPPGPGGSGARKPRSTQEQLAADWAKAERGERA
jgi:hypothetical protein